MTNAQRREIALIKDDPWLESQRGGIELRIERLTEIRSRIDVDGGLMGPISEGHHRYGFTRSTGDARGVWYREWAPSARALFLIGDFNGWDRAAHPMQRDDWGVWSLFLPDAEYAERLTHESKVKVHIVGADDTQLDRIPAYIRRVLQTSEAGEFVGQFWMPPTPYAWQNQTPITPHGEGLRIYEAHIGMATEAHRVGTYDEFADQILPRIAGLGYNAIQLMAIQEHPYYGSFGYHVSNFYAPSSRFGTPEALKRLIDTAHGLGLRVLLDVVHSHAVKNLYEGLSRFDGTDYQYFHTGVRGEHPLWDSLLFDYARYEVQRFLLSNIRYWLEEFRFDGFRFDGVTSMIYRDHGIKHEFTSYDHYFGDNIDEDAITYLQTGERTLRTPSVPTRSLVGRGSVGDARALPAAIDEGGIWASTTVWQWASPTTGLN